MRMWQQIAALVGTLAVSSGAQAVRVSEAPHVFLQPDGSALARWIVDGEVEQRAFAPGQPVVLPEFAGLLGDRLELHVPETPPWDWIAPGKLLVLSDVEGEYDTLYRFLSANGVLDEDGRWAYGDGHLLGLGDMVDRGDQVTESLWLFYRLSLEAAAAGGHVHFVLGNHEAMVMGGDVRYAHGKYFEAAERLGTTVPGLLGANTVLGRWLRTRNSVERIGDFVFVHAGLSTETVGDRLDYDWVNTTIRASLGAPPGSLEDRKAIELVWGRSGPLWYRGYFAEYRDSFGPTPSVAGFGQLLQACAARHIVVGHTKVESVAPMFDGGLIPIDIPWDRPADVRALLVEGERVGVVDIEGRRRDLDLGRPPTGVTPTPPPTSAQAQEPIVGGAARLAAWERHRALAESSPFAGLEWRALGPKNCGGRVEGLDSPAGQPSVIYAGVGSGGVWKSVNGGLSWAQVFAHESTFAVGDVTVDPSDGDTVWVGTGEAHLGGHSYDGTGVFKSVDAGQTWRNMGLHDSARIGKVLVDPTRSEVVYVAAIGSDRRNDSERGVYKSEDGGESWRRCLQVDNGIAVIDLVLDPFDPSRLWAAAWDRRRGGRGGVYRTTDGGEHWTRLEGGLLAGNDVGRIAIAAAPSRAGVLYALMVDHSPPGNGRYDVGGALFRSDDGGDTWGRTSETYVDTYVGWDFCDVMVSPDDADEVYVCGMRLMCSRDGGKSFQRGGEKVFRLLDHPGRGMHLDMHDLWIDPANPDRVLLGTDGGLYESRDRARSWLHLNNLPIAEFYTVHLDDAEPFNLWGGTQDNASLMAPSTAQLVDERPDAWRYVFLDPWDGGDGFATFPDPSGDGTVYYEHQNGDMRRKNPGAPVRWGRDSGRRITPRPAAGEPPLRFSWNTPLFASVHRGEGGGALYCATQYAMRSMDRGDTWQRISDDLTGGRGAIVSLSESPLDAQRLVSGAAAAQVFLTDDGGRAWRAAGEGLPPRPLCFVRASCHDPDRVYVGLSGARSGDRRPYLYRSADFGRSWTAIAADLPAEPVQVLIEDPARQGILYVGTELGVYVSLDDGASWLSLCNGLPTAPVVAMALHSAEQTLVIATHGLSAFAADVRAIRAAAK